MLPTYALEQMVCLEVLPEERERSVKIARHGMCVQQAEFDRLSADIRGNARGTRLPLESIPLEAAARQIGGREKPWGAIFDALRRGKMEYWLSGPAISSRTVRVLPSAFEAFRQVTFDASIYPNFPFESSIVSAEVEEILNVHPANLPLLVEHGLISFERSSNKNFASRVDVVGLAEKMVSSAELSYALKVGPRKVAAVAFRMGARPLGCGWSRAHLVALGVLAPLPHLLWTGKSERL